MPKMPHMGWCRTPHIHGKWPSRIPAGLGGCYCAVMTSESRPRVCLLTGATLGIGRAAAEALVPMGVELVLVARDRARLEALAAELRRRTPGAKVGVLAGDLSRMSEVRRIAREFRATHDRLHVLANNAGALFTKRELTPEGLERTLALNHLAYFVLTEELLPVLRASAPARTWGCGSTSTTSTTPAGSTGPSWPTDGRS